MDIYQANLINKTSNIALSSIAGSGKVEINENEIVFTQNEDYKVTSYIFELTNNAIESIEVDGQPYFGSGAFKITIDFNLKKSKLTVRFKNNFADPCVFDLKYIDADKSSFDAKVDEENKIRLLHTAKIHVKVGIDLLNVYWCNCCKDVAYTRVTLLEKEDNHLLAIYDSEPNIYFKSIAGLAFNDYIIKVEQFTKDNKIIISTELPVQLNDFYGEISDNVNKIKSNLNKIENLTLSIAKRV